MKMIKNTLTLVILAIVTTACLAPPTESPIPDIRFADANSPNKTLVVMLPGRGDRAEVFVREGFEKAGQQHGFDTIMVDAHFGYYMKRSLMPALHNDIILPAREAGYETIWLLGVSMGGLGSLIYTSQHPEQVDGLILLAPFLGDDDVIEEVKNAGGLAQWDPKESDVKDYEIEVWSWLQDNSISDTPTPIMLGFGTSDRLASAYPVLTDALDPEYVLAIDGDHGWDTWKVLWAEFSQNISQE